MQKIEVLDKVQVSQSGNFANLQDEDFAKLL
jgi:hypothetical protein